MNNSLKEKILTHLRWNISICCKVVLSNHCSLLLSEDLLKKMVSIFVKGDGGIIQIFPDSHATDNSSKEIKLIFSYWKSKSEVHWIHYWKMVRFCMFKLNTTCVFIGKFSSWLQKNL